MNPVKRNSGAVLQPAMMKYGRDVHLQAVKMRQHTDVFAPVLDYGHDQYIMPMLNEREPGDQPTLLAALAKLERLWSAGFSDQPTQPRVFHHAVQVEPLATKELLPMLLHWASKAKEPGIEVTVVHGDATTENIMMYEGEAVWIDPSTRPMPAEAEFDGGKLLQSYFGYGGAKPEPAIVGFLRGLGCNRNLLGYYLMTHLVRLYKVQPWARGWAIDLAINLEERMEEAWRL